MPSTSVRCPNCGHALLTVDLPGAFQCHAMASSSRPREDAPLLLRIPEAARLLGVSRTTMYQLVARGEVSVLRIGRSVRVSSAELERMVAVSISSGAGGFRQSSNGSLR